MYIVFTKYCVFSKIFKSIPDSGLSRIPLVVSVCTQWQGKSQRTRNFRAQKNHNILRKNTIFNEHPVVFSEAITLSSNRAIFSEHPLCDNSLLDRPFIVS